MNDRPDSFREVLSPGENRAQDGEMPGHGNTPADSISGGGTAITCSTVESALLEHPKIAECVVLPRKRTDGGGEFVAFFVRSGTVTENELCTHLRKVLGESVVGGFVQLSGLPFTRDGEVDEAALLRLPVLGADVARHCEESLRSLPRVDQAMAVLVEAIEPPPALHLTDVVTDWTVEATGEETATGTERSTSVSPEMDMPPSKPALAQGDDLRLDPHRSCVLAANLRRVAREHDDHGIVHVRPDGSEDYQRYSSLLDEAQRVLTGLRSLGLQPGDTVLFQFQRSRDFLPAFWGCILAGVVPAPLATAPTYTEPNSGLHRFRNAWQLLEQPFVLASEAIYPAIRSLSDTPDFRGLRVETVTSLLSCQEDPNWHEARPDDVALIMLTSGSTGMPKGVMLTHRNLVSRSAGSTQMNGFTSEDVSLNWMPLDHVAGLIYFHLRDVYLGCQQVHAPTDSVLQAPLKWLDWIEQFRATVTFAPNFAYGLVNDHWEEIQRSSWDLSSVRFVLNGAEAIVCKTARRFLELLIPHGLPPTAMCPVWGMSETSSGTSYSRKFRLDSTSDMDQFVEVGAPIPGFSMRVVNDRDEVVQEGVIGRLQVAGTTVTPGYFKSPDLNRESFTSDGWFRTGDLALLRDGSLTITGREKDVIIINSVKYYCHEIEGVVEEVDGVVTSNTAACGVRTIGAETDRLAVFFVPNSEESSHLVEMLRAIRKNVVRRVGIPVDYLVPVREQDIPKTPIGKIQRPQLGERFRRGDFEETVRRVDVLLANRNTIPNWFFRPVWRRKQLRRGQRKQGRGACLILSDEVGLGAQLLSEMRRRDQRCICAQAGSRFSSLAPDQYSIDMNNPADYDRLLEAQAKQAIEIDRIIHLCTLDPNEQVGLGLRTMEHALERGPFSLLFLVHALDRIKGDADTSRTLLFVSNYVQSVLPGDRIVPEKSVQLGFVKTIPQEYSWLRCCHVDLDAGEPDEYAARVLDELECTLGDEDVAYRDGQRWVLRFEEAGIGREEKQPLPFKQKGLYLVSGGLGGIGTEIAKHLLERYGARLLIIGRTALGEKGGPHNEQEREGAAVDRAHALRMLECLGGEVAYAAADVGDPVRLRSIVEAAESRWQQRLDGVVHLAGTFEERLLADETPTTVLAALRPKVMGAWALHELMQSRPGGFFVSFSSVNGYFGGFSAGAYAAANAFLNSFAMYQRYHDGTPSYDVAWSLWDEVGMSRGYGMKDLTRARGYHLIPAGQGLLSFVAALHSGQSRLLVGLDPTNRHVRRRVETESVATQQLRAFYTTVGGAVSTPAPTTLMVRDRFGTPASCETRRVDNLPGRTSGEIDPESLLRLARGNELVGQETTPPQTDLERTIAGIWRDVLQLQAVGIDQNLFDLGGPTPRRE